MLLKTKLHHLIFGKYSIFKILNINDRSNNGNRVLRVLFAFAQEIPVVFQQRFEPP